MCWGYRIIQNNLAVSNVEDFLSFYNYSNLPVLSSLYRHEKSIEEYHNLVIEEIKVHTTTLNNYCKLNGVNHINFLKIDTEGNEFNVIKGSENLTIDYIQFEYGGVLRILILH